MTRKFEIATPGTGGLLAAAGSLQALLTLGLLALNQISNIGATTLFALSGRADRWRTFILFQILGGFFGLFAQLTFAGMVRYSSLPFANAAGIGLAFVSVQIFSAVMILHETISPMQWLGSALVFAGVLLIAAGQH